MNETPMTGKYKIVGEPGDYQIMETFGAYRISKKRYKTIEKAAEAIKKKEALEA